MSESKEVNFALRLPPELDEIVRQSAADNRRSINAEIVTILESWFDVHALRARLAALEAQR